MKAKAIVFRAANKPSLEELDLPALRPNDLLVRAHYTGVSIGTEQSIFSGVRTQNGTFPLVGGYQASGVVERVGAEVQGFAVGDKVVACGSRLDGPVRAVFGGQMSRLVVPVEKCGQLPEGAPMPDASMIVLLRVAQHALTAIAPVDEHDVVLIQGQGLVGQFFGQFVRNRGAKIIAIEPLEQRAALSRQYVTPHVLDPRKEDVVARVKELTGGAGPSIVVEATGNKALIPHAAAHLRPKGRMVFLAWYPGEISFDYHTFHAREVTAHFPMSSGDHHTMRMVLDCLARGAVVVGDNITDLVSYEAACAGYQRIINRDPNIMGMVIDWRGA